MRTPRTETDLLSFADDRKIEHTTRRLSRAAQHVVWATRCNTRRSRLNLACRYRRAVR
jgi:hypothetical protein